MNCILLFESDFIDEQKSVVRVFGRRKDHIESVFRAVPGKEYKVGLLNGPLGSGKVVKIDSEKLEMEVSLNLPPPASLPLVLIMALCRPKSLKKSIEVATSLGIKQIFVIESWRVEKSFWTSPLLEPERILEHVYLGLEQAKDTVAPKIEFRKRFKPFVEDEIPQIIKGTCPLVAHPYNGIPCPHQLQSAITLAIGPEGGFIPYEIELLGMQGFESISLGERILRVEYAIPALVGRLL
jgi:16S rRNA (uracil1498-N3)-methyltransferase